MDRIEKEFRLMSPKEQEVMSLLLLQLKDNYHLVPGLKRLRGKSGWFRVRMGRYRVIFIAQKTGAIEIMRITKRDEKTYKNLA